MTNGRVICVMARVLDQADGLGVYSLSLLKELAARDPTTRYVVLLRESANAEALAGFENVTVEVLPARSKLLWDQLVVPRAAARHRADILFNPKFSLPLLARTPGVFVLHGSDWYVHPESYPWWDRNYIRLLLPIYVRKAARLLAISRTTVEHLTRYIGLDPAKVMVSYAAPAAHFTVAPEPAALAAFRARHNLPERFLLTVARTWHTGHAELPPYPGGNNERLMRAYRRYRDAGGTLPLVVVGHRVEDYLRQRGFTAAELADVRFLGFVPNPEMPLAYHLADAMVLVTLNESFCLPLVEAMACGCPTVMPDTGAVPEIAGGASRLVDPFDEAAIAQGLLDVERQPELRERLKVAGLERVREFTWARTAAVTLATFDLIRPGRAPTAGKRRTHDQRGAEGVPTRHTTSSVSAT